MTASARVARTRAQLRVVALVSACLWGAATLCTVLAAELVAGAWKRGNVQPNLNWNIAIALAAVAVVVVLWRARFVLSARHVALWIEERAPALQYALITASDPQVTSDKSLLEAAIDRSNIDTLVRPAVLTPVIYSGVALSVMAGAFAAALTFASGRNNDVVTSPASAPAASIPAGSRLVNLSVRVVAPAYAGSTTQALTDPSGVTALVGSRISVRGSGVPDGIRASVAGQGVNVTGHANWQATFTMPSSATTLSLTDRDYDRVIAMIPIVDQPPSVTMVKPNRDTVWRRVPSGAISFLARATDDIGLADGHLEYTVTTGSGEIFKSRTANFAAARLAGAKAGEIGSMLALAPLGLAPGAILSVRAVVADNNSLSGPTLATSDTRTFRVARADEYDSLAVDAAPPPPVERSLLTERILIVSAESLLKKRQYLESKEFVTSSGRIGVDQADLRKKVYNILYEQDEAGGEQGVEGDDEELDPQLVLNRDLKQAYDAMWDAERSLNVGEITAALPFMTRALHALDRARLANRLYLRGRTPRIVVNVERVRLTGKEKGIAGGVATESARADTAILRLDTTLVAALRMVRTDSNGFVDALIRLRAGSVAINAQFASALGDAVDAFRAGKDMTPSLVRARRALLGAPRPGNAAVPWTGSWSGKP